MLILNKTTNTGPQQVFRALSDPSRRHILLLLSQQKLSIGAVAAQFSISRSAIQKHLLILQQSGLISVQKEGRERLNRLEPMAIKAVVDWLQYFDQFWDERLNKLKVNIENQPRNDDD